MISVKEIMQKAVSMGACSHCKDNNYPSIESFRSMAKYVEPYCVYVEKPIEKHNENVALIGEAESTLRYDGVEKAYKVILMHGAKATIHVSNYAVVRLENISGEYEIINDGTAEVLV